MSVSLIYIPSREIVRYVTTNPINWMDEKRHLANRPGCVADQAGTTPIPAVQMFLECYHAKQNLFTQAEYRAYCFQHPKWTPWLVSKPAEQVEGVGVKLYRNFYPAMVDSLHVWALLVETGKFDYCVLDSTSDAIGKTDLTVKSGDYVVRVALSVDSPQANYAKDYKNRYRGGLAEGDIFTARLPMNMRPRSPGNKRWYCVDDFKPIIERPSTLNVSNIQRPKPVVERDRLF